MEAGSDPTFMQDLQGRDVLRQVPCQLSRRQLNHYEEMTWGFFILRRAIPPVNSHSNLDVKDVYTSSGEFDLIILDHTVQGGPGNLENPGRSALVSLCHMKDPLHMPALDDS